MSLLNKLKYIPIDLGQGTLREKTKGKLIAFSYIPKPKEGLKALDIGCREGIQSERLKEMGYDVTSIDIDPKYEHGVQHDVNTPLPFADKSFDLVWCSEVIEHLTHPERSISEMRRVLNKNGRLIITTPNSYAWFLQDIRTFWP